MKNVIVRLLVIAIATTACIGDQSPPRLEVRPHDICVQQSCRRLRVAFAPVDGNPLDVIAVADDNPNADRVCQSTCGPGALCPMMQEDEEQLLSNAGDAACRVQYTRFSKPYFSCLAQFMVDGSTTQCEGGGNGAPP